MLCLTTTTITTVISAGLKGPTASSMNSIPSETRNQKLRNLEEKKINGNKTVYVCTMHIHAYVLSVWVLLIFYDFYYILNDSLNRGEVSGIARLDQRVESSTLSRFPARSIGKLWKGVMGGWGVAGVEYRVLDPMGLSSQSLTHSSPPIASGRNLCVQLSSLITAKCSYNPFSSIVWENFPDENPREGGVGGVNSIKFK